MPNTMTNEQAREAIGYIFQPEFKVAFWGSLKRNINIIYKALFNMGITEAEKVTATSKQQEKQCVIDRIAFMGINPEKIILYLKSKNIIVVIQEEISTLAPEEERARMKLVTQYGELFERIATHYSFDKALSKAFLERKIHQESNKDILPTCGPSYADHEVYKTNILLPGLLRCSNYMSKRRELHLLARQRIRWTHLARSCLQSHDKLVSKAHFVQLGGSHSEDGRAAFIIPNVEDADVALGHNHGVFFYGSFEGTRLLAPNYKVRDGHDDELWPEICTVVSFRHDELCQFKHGILDLYDRATLGNPFLYSFSLTHYLGVEISKRKTFLSAHVVNHRGYQFIVPANAHNCPISDAPEFLADMTVFAMLSLNIQPYCDELNTALQENELQNAMNVIGICLSSLFYPELRVVAPITLREAEITYLKRK